MPPKVVELVFRTPKGAAASAEGNKETERFVFRVTDVVDPQPDPTSSDSKAIAETLKNSFGEDLVSEYISRLENDFGVTVNPSALNQVIGGAPQQ